MRKEELYEILEDIDENYVSEAHQPMQKKSRSAWLKWGAMAACLLFIIGGVVTRLSNLTHDGRTVISKYKSYSSGCYSTPSPGEVTYTSEVWEARKKYSEKDVTFLLAFDMFKDDGEQIVELSDEERMEEYQRFISLGYELYIAECWTYRANHEKQYYHVVVGYFTESDLSLFSNNPEYGYMFKFATNGDGSGISVEEKDIITDFSTNYS